MENSFNNVEGFLGGRTNSKTLHKEISIKNSAKGDAIKVVDEDIQRGTVKETYKEK